MEVAVVEKYLDRMEELVFIEEKIVTCISLCQALTIHVNTAKQLLFLFSQKETYREKVLVMFLIGGVLPEGGIQMKLIEADKREETKKQFDHVTMDHVYSVQKWDKFSLVDVYNANPSFHLPSDTRLLLCPVRPPHTIGKRNIKIPVVEDKKDTIKSSLQTPNTSKKPLDEPKKEVLTKPAKSDSPKKKKKASPEKNKKANSGKSSGGGISSFFSLQANKMTATTAKMSGQEEPKKSPSVKPNDKEAKGIGSFFKEVPSKVKPDKGSNGSAKHEESNKPGKQSKDVNNKEERSDTARKQVNGVAKDVTSKASKNKKRKKKNKEKDESNLKKRRRIMAMDSSSEDSDKDGSDSEEEMREDVMEVDEEPPPPVIPEEEEDMIPPTPGRKRVRKQIDKVFTDDEGFVLTKKEYVYESCSDDEAVQEEKENINNKVADSDKTPTVISDNIKENGKKTVGKEKGKKRDEPPPSKVAKKASPKGLPKSQASITNFFMKK